MVDEVFYVAFSRLEDLVKFVAYLPTPFIQHVEINSKHVYFIHSTLLASRPVIYYVCLNSKLEKRYVIYNKFNDSISYSDKLETGGQSVTIPILEIKDTNLLRISLK
jgi:hypothetical protein